MAKTSRTDNRTPFARITTGIPGMDSLLAGGFLAGGTYLILGAPGTGKTVFANQLSFHHIREGGRALYLTLLAENHSRMFGNLKEFDFFDESRISDGMQYISGYSVLEKEGLAGLLKLLGDLVRRHQSTVVFIDGIASADELAGSAINFKKFIHHLNSVLGLSNCTAFLLSSAQGDDIAPEHTMVDGIVNLSYTFAGMNTMREIEVRKFRGSAHLYGRHCYEISENGLSIYTRIEETFKDDFFPNAKKIEQLDTGVKGLNEILSGGYVKGNVIGLLGPSGAGKTTIGSQFLVAGARKKEKALYISLYEHPERWAAKMQSLGMGVDSLLKNGTLQVYRPTIKDRLADKLFHNVIRMVEEENIERVFIDGLGGVLRTVSVRERLADLMNAVRRKFQSLGVTTIFAEESDLDVPQLHGQVSHDSAVTDIIIEFKSGPTPDGAGSQAYLQVVKSRESDLDRNHYAVGFEKGGVFISRPTKARGKKK